MLVLLRGTGSLKYLARFTGETQKHFLYLAVCMIWLKTYFTHRFQFELPVSGWYQELILFISPASSILVLLGLTLLFLRHRPDRAVIIVSAVSGLLLLANMLYYRFFNDFITFSIMRETTHIGQLGSSIFELLRGSDIFVFADTAVLLMMKRVRNYRIVSVGRSQSLFTIAFAVTLFLLNLCMVEIVRPGLLSRTFDRQMVVKSIGAFNYLVYDAVVTTRMETRTVLSNSEDLAVVKAYLAAEPKDKPNPKMFGLAKGRNVFIVSMESLQSFMLERQMLGHELTPFLNSLIKDSFYFDQFYHQTGQGKTSDAEFIIDNMLYPLPSGAVFFTHSHNKYYSVPKQLKENGYYPVVLHANDKTFWNREQMYKTLGYKRFFSAEDYDVTEETSVGWGLKDIPFFEQSVDKIRTLPQPFYAKLITLTNHYPFTLEEEDTLIPQFNSNSKTLNRYVTTVRYMDEALKHFFDSVKAAGLYDNSVFILYGDHYGISKKHRKAMAMFLEKDKLSALDHIQLQRVPLIIHIPGVKGKRMSVVSGQIDVKPTILHLVGNNALRGLGFGHDLFALNKPDFAVLRDGSFITKNYVYTNGRCYRKETGEKIDGAFCEPSKEQAQTHLRFSDKVIYGDLNRFSGSRKKPHHP
jgi:lipoteichoic acid synthase